MLATLRSHVRHNVVAYIALFFALGGSSAYAANTVFSEDIVDGEVKNQDLAPSSVGTGKIADGHVRTADVLDNELTGADLKTSAVGASDISNSAFRSSDIVALTNLVGRKQFGLADNAVQSAEIQNGAVRYEDLAKNARPTAFVKEDVDTGKICNNGCNEGSLTLPPGNYAISAKINLLQYGGGKLGASCYLNVGPSRRDVAVLDGLDQLGATAPRATLSLQTAQELSSGGTVALNCRDRGEGDARGRWMKITAVEVGSIG